MAYTTIDDPSAYFQTKIYAGTDASPQAFTLDGNSDLQPDWVWIKNRGYANKHVLFDSVRGVNKSLTSNSNAVELDQNSDGGYLSAFNSDGFTLTEGSSSDNDTNDDRYNYVAWCWKETATAGFDIIAYQGTGSNLDVSHNLSAIPDWIMIKDRSVDQAWRVYSKSMGFSNRLVLSESGAKSTSALGLDADPTSSVINIGTGTGTTNTSGDNYICYAFKNVQGFSKFGSYTGNGNADGTFVYTGFKPAFVMIKNTTTSGKEWVMHDNKRNTHNPTNKELVANANNAEYDDTRFDFLSNGLKIRDSASYVNTSGDNYIYMAFAENPFVTSTGVPTTAR